VAEVRRVEITDDIRRSLAQVPLLSTLAAARPDFPGLEPSSFARPNLLCEPLKHDPTGTED